jgi:hypothetical protein
MENLSVVLTICLVLLIVLMYNNNDCKRASYHRSRNYMDKVRDGSFDSVSQGMSSSGEINDYNDYLLNTGLEQSVVDSHNKFTEGITTTTSGASAMTEVSHDDNLVPWYGLRRPRNDVYIDPNAREVPSVYQKQLSKNKKYSSCGLY